MWVRQCDLDAEADFLPPIPSRIASNEEFVPPPQSAEQKEYEVRLAEISERAAQAAGPLPPRLPPQRQRHGRRAPGPQPGLRRLLRGRGRGGRRSEGVRGALAQGPVRLRRPDAPRRRRRASGTTTRRHGRGIKSFFRMLRPEAKSDEHAMELLNRAHYVKEVFGDSDTVMAVISGVPSRDWDKNPLPPDQMVATRKFVNDLAGSRRVLSHGLLRPNLGQARARGDGAAGQGTEDRRLEDVHRRRDRREGLADGRREGRLSRSGRRPRPWGSRTSASTRGCRWAAFNEEACRPLDLEKAAKDWPDLNFIVYHSGFRGFGWLAKGTGIKVVDPKTNDPQEIPWISDILRILKRNPDIKNIYFELGSTFNILSSYAPRVCMHMLGADDPGRRRRPHPLGHRLDLERQPAEPDRAAAAAQDRRRPDRQVRLSPADATRSRTRSWA